MLDKAKTSANTTNEYIKNNIPDLKEKIKKNGKEIFKTDIQINDNVYKNKSEYNNASNLENKKNLFSKFNQNLKNKNFFNLNFYESFRVYIH